MRALLKNKKKGERERESKKNPNKELIRTSNKDYLVALLHFHLQAFRQQVEV